MFKQSHALNGFSTLMCLMVLSSASAQTDSNQRFQAHLDSGEFTLALDVARNTSNPDLADRRFAQIASSQYAGGANKDAFNTASMIENDQGRSESLRYLYQVGNANGPGFGGNSGLGNGSGQEAPGFGGAMPGATGGITEADFQELMDLILETIDPDSWEENGGSGRMMPFPAGVFVDSEGTLREIKTAKDSSLDMLRNQSRRKPGIQAVSHPAELRKISLPRLERALQHLAAQGKPASEEMMRLAGIYKIEYVFFYPESNDIVIAGPAGPWHYDWTGRAINTETGTPVLYLDDLAVCLRNAREYDGQFGCSIDPREENLAQLKQFLDTTTLRGSAWSKALREILGFQDVTVQGIDPATHAGRVIVEADYRMKLVGMGLEPGVEGLKSYFDRLHVDEEGNAPASDLVRWWFTMNYDAVTSNEERNVFAINGQGVKVLSESEFLDEQGRRVHTGQSTSPTKGFADDLTHYFIPMTKKYPIYGELRNLFDWALVTNLIRSQRMADKIDWQAVYFDPADRRAELAYQVATENTPVQVSSVVNERVMNARRPNGNRVKHTVVGVSGGVTYDAQKMAAADKIKTAADSTIIQERKQSSPLTEDWRSWWWD